jgi:hypothetical protein
MALVQMRAGTQTLIQALQALPLVDDPEIDDEFTSHDMNTAESDSDDEGRHGKLLLYFRTFAICNAIQRRLWRPLSTRFTALWLALVEGNR